MIYIRCACVVSVNAMQVCRQRAPGMYKISNSQVLQLLCFKINLRYFMSSYKVRYLGTPLQVHSVCRFCILIGQ